MARINANGDMVTITTDITLEMFNKIRHFKPDTLKLKNENGDETFRIDFNPEWHNEVSNNGIVFHSVDTQGHMFLTTVNEVVGMHNDLELERKLITERYTGTLIKLDEIESQIAYQATEINEMSESVQNNITIEGE